MAALQMTLSGKADPVQLAPLVLASASPRRRALLSQLGLRFEVEESGVDEPAPERQAPEAYAASLARLKAEAVRARRAVQGSDAFVLAADTIVVVDAAVLGKPRDDAEAVRMLAALAGREHEVITAVVLVCAGASAAHEVTVRSRVQFRAFDEAGARRYVATGEGRDKAGSYAVQGRGAGLVRAIFGSYSNVVGLPVCETLELLVAAGAVEQWP